MNPESYPEEENENNDLDMFAQWRPKDMGDGEVNPDEESNEEDFDPLKAYRPKPMEESQRSGSQKEKDLTPDEIAKDVAQQTIKGVTIGAFGTYGDLLSAVGLNKKSDTSKKKTNNEFRTLEKMQKGEETPSFSDLYSLSDSDEIGPGQGMIPTTQGLEKISEKLGVGEAKSMPGRYAARTSKLYGGGLAFGQVNPVPSLVAGIAGQTAEEFGADPLLQAGIEIASLLASPGQGHRALTESAKKEVQAQITNLRSLGYTEEQIALAINKGSKGKKFGVKANKSSKTEEAFEGFAEHSNELVEDILTGGVKGYEKGPKHVHQMASDAYGHIADSAKSLTIKKFDDFFDVMDTSIKEIRRTLGNNAEAKKFITEISENLLDMVKNPNANAEDMMNFYRQMNALGKWVPRNQKDRLLTNIKDSIKDTFKAEGKAGVKVAEDFEKVNKGIQRAYKAEDVYDVMQKAHTQNGYDFNKLYKAFDKTDNVELFKEVLGKEATAKLQSIAKTGKEIKDFDKAWKATNLVRGNNAIDAGLGLGFSYYLFKGDIEGMAEIMAAKGLGMSAKKISEMFLRNPKFQNIVIKGLHSIKNQSGTALKSATNQLMEFLEDEEIDVD